MIHSLQPSGCSTACVLLPLASAIGSGHPVVRFFSWRFVSNWLSGIEHHDADSKGMSKIDHFTARAPGKDHAMVMLGVMLAVVRVAAKKVMAI